VAVAPRLHWALQICSGKVVQEPTFCASKKVDDCRISMINDKKMGTCVNS
jgi:hypothetical protein